MNTSEQLHWVFYCQGEKIRYFLANNQNRQLAYPFLKNLTSKEIQHLTSLGLVCCMDPSNHLYYDVISKEDKKSMITAPLYFRMSDGENYRYSKMGEYTDEYTSLEAFQFVNETVANNIPAWKIHIPGRYISI